MLQNLNITHGGLSEPHLTVSGTSRKYFEIHLEIDDANKLDKTLISHYITVQCPKLGYFQPKGVVFQRKFVYA